MIARIPRGWMATVCLVAGGLVVLFWSVWFIARDVVASEQRSEYFTFENAFPVADGWFAFCCFAAALCLFRGQETARLWLIAAGSASIFLTGMDVLYDLENGIYGKGSPAAIELGINVLTAMFGIASMVWAHTNKAAASAEAPGTTG